MSEGINYPKIHTEINENLGTNLDSIILDDARVGINELLWVMFEQFHRINITTEDKVEITAWSRKEIETFQRTLKENNFHVKVNSLNEYESNAMTKFEYIHIEQEIREKVKNNSWSPNRIQEVNKIKQGCEADLKKYKDLNNNKLNNSPLNEQKIREIEWVKKTLKNFPELWDIENELFILRLIKKEIQRKKKVLNKKWQRHDKIKGWDDKYLGWTIRIHKPNYSVNKKRTPLETGIILSNDFSFKDIPNLISELQRKYSEIYKEKWVVPKDLNLGLLNKDLDKLFVSLDLLSKTFETKSRTLLNRLKLEYLQYSPKNTTLNPKQIKKIRRNISKRAYFYFCLSLAFSVKKSSTWWEESIKEKNNPFTNSSATTEEFKKFIEENPNSHSQTEERENIGIEDNIWAFGLEAVAYIEANETIWINDLELFTDAVENSFREKWIFEQNKDKLIEVLKFPKIEKKDDWEYETYSEYSRRAILEIGKALDNTEFINLDSSNLNIADKALSEEHRDIIFDELMDYMKSISKREVVREWDLFQVIEDNFKINEMTKITEQVWLNKEEIVLFTNIEDAKAKLKEVRENLKNSSEEEKEKYQNELNQLEYNIALLLSLIIYNEEFYSYDLNNKKVLFSEERTKSKSNMCFWQWWLMDNALRWIFWIKTYASWVDKGKFWHFIPMLTSWKRTDTFSPFNSSNTNKFQSYPQVWWIDRKIYWDIESLHNAINYVHLRQSKNFIPKIDINLQNQINKQIPWHLVTYFNIWKLYHFLWNYDKALKYFLRAEALITGNLPEKHILELYYSTMFLYYKTNNDNSIIYSYKVLEILKTKEQLSDWEFIKYINAIIIKLKSSRNLIFSKMLNFINHQENTDIYSLNYLEEKYSKYENGIKEYLSKSGFRQSIIEKIGIDFIKINSYKTIKKDNLSDSKTKFIKQYLNENTISEKKIREMTITEEAKDILISLLTEK